MSSPRPRRWQERLPDEPHEADLGSTALAVERVAHYDALIDFEMEILAQMVEDASALSEEARKEAEESNLDPQRALIDEFRRRRDSWDGRLASSGSRTDPTPTPSK